MTLHDVLAPAKLNLFLHITGRRADGYHLLQSAFMLIDWCDTLHFELRPSGISREDLSTPLPTDDLVLRAARALQSATGTTQGAHIAIDKQIPAQAGMGGGSSDAASTLIALNRLWGLGLKREQLMAIGLQLGADVPFFIGGSHAWVEGIGELLTPLQLPAAQFLVAKPNAGLPTALIFSDPQLKRDSFAATITGFAAHPFGFGRNDLQPVAEKLCPEMVLALKWLESLGLHGRMTGSGSAVFAWAPENFDVPSAQDTLKVRLCSNLAAHPLAGWVD
jgi:4-diphosphocytidyl-2-C-methyl-D-erythritol kinase